MTHEDFIQAILADPDDDTPRLIFADWLEERGDPRGEFIRVQCELAKLIDPFKNWWGMYGSPLPLRNPKEKDRVQQLRTRELKLLMTHCKEWVAPLGPLATGLIFERGFVEGLHTDAHTYADRAQAWYPHVPIRQVCLRSSSSHYDYWLKSPFLRHLHTLDCNSYSAEGARGDRDACLLAACPHLVNLRRLRLGFQVRERDKGVA